MSVATRVMLGGQQRLALFAIAIDQHPQSLDPFPSPS
jgi:hypothetical protein